ncbi:hypothetical protein HDV05_001899 [Chytridiales sp. JEL 0842]|nr:hypothetical protein HDV05_001899 [Chytridiales sp. JEL 0842]
MQKRRVRFGGKEPVRGKFKFLNREREESEKLLDIIASDDHFTIRCLVSRVESFDQTPKRMPTLYQRPTKKNQAVFDGCIFGSAMFQMTVSTKHPAPHANIIAASADAGTNVLIYFVPQNVYEEFGYQHPTVKKGGKKFDTVDAELWTQYVVCVDDMNLFKSSVQSMFDERAREKESKREK